MHPSEAPAPGVDRPGPAPAGGPARRGPGRRPRHHGRYYRARAWPGWRRTCPAGPPALAQALTAARGITDGSTAPRPWPRWRRTCRRACSPRRCRRPRHHGRVDRAQALAALAPHLPAPLLAEALAAARDITTRPRAAGADRAGAAPARGAARRGPAAAATSRAIYRAQALAGLAPHLPAALLAEALAAARDIATIHRAPALTGWRRTCRSPTAAPLAEALTAAAHRNEDARAQALAGLAPHLPEADRGTALAEAVSAARDITDEATRARRWPGWPAPAGARLLAEAVSAPATSPTRTPAPGRWRG